MTLQFKNENFISPLNVMLPQKLKFPFNDKLHIRHFDPVKQYYTVEAPSRPGRPIIAPLEALQCGEFFIIAARYYENDKTVGALDEIGLHVYQNQLLAGEKYARFHQLSQLTVSDLIKTKIMYDKLIKQVTTDVAHTDGPTSTLKLLLQQKTTTIQIESRLHAYEEIMRREELTLEKTPQLMMDHQHYTQFYESAKQHLEEVIPFAYRAQNIIKKQMKLNQFGGPHFQS